MKKARGLFRAAVSRVTVLAMILVMATFAGGARADVFFEGLDGDWQGAGFIKSEPNAPEENIRCRLNLGLSRLRDKLYVRGTCSIAGFILPVNGSIVARNSNYSADLFRSLVQVTTNSFSGQRRGSRLTLYYSGTDQMTREAIRAAMIIRKRRGGFDISLSRTPPNSKRYFDIGTIRFQSR